jgi:hypothetical protein
MGSGFARTQLVGRINTAFHADSIATTADSVAHLPPEADAFDIVHELGLFQFPPGATLENYRSELPVPPVNKDVLAAAFRNAIATRTPLRFEIVSGTEESVQVTSGALGITVVLTRID